MSLSQFDPAAFLDAQTEEALVKRPPLPVGDYKAVIGELAPRVWTKKDDPSKSGIAFDVPLTLEVPAEVQKELGIEMPTITLRDSIMVDMTENGTIDWGIGKNRRLRLYREATGMNVAGQVFSPRKLIGQFVTVKLGHGMYEGDVTEEIKGIAGL